ncbi:MAG TPA: hypothetical protein VF483_12580 [Gemmatimonadaceae bacterium]
MQPLTPVRLLAAASSTPAQPDDPTGLKFLNRCGHNSHFDYNIGRSIWPLPRLSSCNALARFAEEVGVLADDPIEGDVFIKYSGFHHRFVRTGIVAAIDYEYSWEGRSVYLCTVIEAGVSRGMALSPITGDRFVRWADLEERRRAA